MRIIGLLFFFILFVIFVVIKSAIQGSKAAYRAVFSAESTNEEVQSIVRKIFIDVNSYMNTDYSGNKQDLNLALMNCSQNAQKLAEANGYNVPFRTTERLVKDIMIDCGYAQERDFV